MTECLLDMHLALLRVFFVWPIKPEHLVHQLRDQLYSILLDVHVTMILFHLHRHKTKKLKLKKRVRMVFRELQQMYYLVSLACIL